MGVLDEGGDVDEEEEVEVEVANVPEEYASSDDQSV